jgi:hypothetical protein
VPIGEQPAAAVVLPTKDVCRLYMDAFVPAWPLYRYSGCASCSVAAAGVVDVPRVLGVLPAALCMLICRLYLEVAAAGVIVLVDFCHSTGAVGAAGGSAYW